MNPVPHDSTARFRTRRNLQLALCLSAMVPAAASAVLATPPSVTNSSPAQPGFGVNFFLDGNLLTDYASNAQGNNTFVDFRFAAPTLITQTRYTDRTSSGGANGSNTRGPLDNVTRYSLTLSRNNTFGDADDRTISVSSPGFANTDSPTLINGGLGFQASAVRFRVTAFNQAGPGNVGGAELEFLTTNQTVWPVYDVNGDGTRGRANRGVMQGFGDGSINSNFIRRMHEGIDVIADGRGGQEVAIVRSGTVIERSGDQGGTVNVRVNVGTAANPIFETDSYVHISNIPAEIRVDGAVAAGAKVGNISSTHFAGTGSHHLHFDVSSGARTSNGAATPGGIVTQRYDPQAQLNPFARFSHDADRDPGGNKPALADTNVDRKSIVITRSGTLTEVAQVSGAVDIVADVRDNMNPSFLGASGVNTVGYYVRATFARGVAKRDVRSAGSPYILAKFDDTFFANGGAALPATLSTDVYATTPPFRVTQDAAVAGRNGTIFPMTRNYIVTNTRARDGVTPGAIRNIDAGQFWNTKAPEDGRSENSDLANMSDKQARDDAPRNAAARFKDGDYEIHIIAGDLLSEEDLNAGRIRLNNFAQAAEPGKNGAAALADPGALAALYDPATQVSFLTGYEPNTPETADIAFDFNPGDTVAVRGEEFYPNLTMPVYVLPHRTWRDGMSFLAGVEGWVTSDAGGFVELTDTLYVAAELGMWDIIIDYDRDSKFSATLDGLTAFRVVQVEVPIPEPQTWLFLLVGAVVIVTVVQRRAALLSQSSRDSDRAA